MLELKMDRGNNWKENCVARQTSTSVKVSPFSVRANRSAASDDSSLASWGIITAWPGVDINHFPKHCPLPPSGSEWQDSRYSSRIQPLHHFAHHRRAHSKHETSILFLHLIELSFLDFQSKRMIYKLFWSIMFLRYDLVQAISHENSSAGLEFEYLKSSPQWTCWLRREIQRRTKTKISCI